MVERGDAFLLGPACNSNASTGQRLLTGAARSSLASVSCEDSAGVCRSCVLRNPPSGGAARAAPTGRVRPPSLGRGIIRGTRTDTIGWFSSASRLGPILTRKRDPGLRKGIAKEIGLRTSAAWIPPSEARYGQPRLEFE